MPRRSTRRRSASVSPKRKEQGWTGGASTSGPSRFDNLGGTVLLPSHRRRKWHPKSDAASDEPIQLGTLGPVTRSERLSGLPAGSDGGADRLQFALATTSSRLVLPDRVRHERYEPHRPVPAGK